MAGEAVDWRVKVLARSLERRERVFCRGEICRSVENAGEMVWKCGSLVLVETTGLFFGITLRVELQPRCLGDDFAVCVRQIRQSAVFPILPV